MVHLYESNGYKIALDVNSGAIHIVDEMAYQLIPQVEELINSGMIEKEKITAFFAGQLNNEMMESLIEVLELYERKMLFTPDTYEDYINELKNRKTVVKALCLHVAHACNLACRYCFAKEITYGHESDFVYKNNEKDNQAPNLMSLDTAKRALDFLVANSGNRRNLEVDFFGGEPLLNWDVVKETIIYGRSLEKEHEKNFRFTLTTNGLLLNEEMFDLINQEISNVVLSIDGRPDVNDRMRPLHDGNGSYELIIEKFKKLAESRKQANYYLRGTFTRENLDFTEDFRHLADLGFKQISIEPMVDNNKPEPQLTASVNEVSNIKRINSDDFSIQKEDLPAIFTEYDHLASEIIKREKSGQAINFFHFMIDLTGGPCALKRLSGCGAGTEYLAVTPTGDLYPCHQFVENLEYLMGNLDDGIIKTDIYNSFKATTVYTKPKCRDCFAKYYCSGGCAANAQKLTGNITDCDDIACDLQRKRTECAIMIKATT